MNDTSVWVPAGEYMCNMDHSEPVAALQSHLYCWIETRLFLGSVWHYYFL